MTDTPAARAGADGAAEFLRGLWYVAATSSTLRRGQMRNALLLGEPVLIGRMNDGRIFALRDICPHRGVPLSAGRITSANTVECSYHGWRFRADGACAAIPSLVEGQEMDLTRIGVRSYPAREHNGLVWVYFAAAAHANRAPVVEPPAIALAGAAVPCFVERQTFRCGIDHAVIGLMDPAHGPFVHQAWYWRSRNTIHPKAKAFVPSRRGFTMAAHKPSSNSLAYRILGGNVSTEIRFELPGLRFEHIRAGPTEVVGLTSCTPVDANSTEVTQVFYWNAGWLSIIRPFFRPFARRFLGQDRRMVELQREGLKFNPPLMLIRDADTPALWYYRLKKAWNESVAAGTDFANPVPASTLRWRS